MKKSKMKVCAVLLLTAFVATGCGDEVYDLTDTEETQIVNYAAHVVSKFNTRQPDGLVYVKASVEETEETEEAVSTEETAEELSTEETTETTPEENAVQTEEENTQPQQATLTETLQIAGVEADFVSAELRDSYVEEDYFAMDASEDKTYLVVNVSLTNTTEEDIDCDLLSQTPQFQANVNETGYVPAETTILLNDLSTYQGVIPAGSSAETVVLFQVSKDVNQVDTLKLQIKMNNTWTEISCM